MYCTDHLIMPDAHQGQVQSTSLICDFGNELSELLVFVLLHFRRATTTIPFAPPMLCVGDVIPQSACDGT